MLKTQLILKKIEEVRTLMYDLMSEKQKLTDKELVELSQKLDKLLNEYDELVNSRK
ncbi:aspartyl-phosphate phosphatase Spo0E family protein [Clostridium frigidicarnis]|uniref:Spo0E like sporulation regulatory protein n=1 Tax=Clostridium frigidicarnis TaxID=84698 RepID=A0A1I1AYU3_9CLOT|nr:aspartyl-phosphate phosphatase Spo0E family protein [Clostridium frigidicarnis]SFB43201.1 Spo0E like sporulation regulatory protein [Clostridium frigidicarnis]